MSNTHIFNIKIQERSLDSHALPPEDPLRELSDFEMRIRHFCYEYNYQTSIQVGDYVTQVFFDPDICILLENNLPQKVADLSQGQTIKISFCESCCLIIELVPQDSKISCSLQEFGYSTKKLHFDLDKNQVLKTLVNFINQVMEKAVISGFITFMEKEQYMIPVLIKAMR